MDYKFDSYMTHDPRSDLFMVRIWDEYDGNTFEDTDLTLSEVDALLSRGIKLELMEYTGIPQYDLL